MTIIGMQFSKISIEKMNPLAGKVSINNNVTIKSVEKSEITLGTTKQEVLKFSSIILFASNRNFFIRIQRIR